MNTTEKHLKQWANHPQTDKRMLNELLEKTDFTVKDGLFDHHVSFFHVGVDGYVYYKTYFGNGWNKRKPNNQGWIKYLNSLAVNVNTGEYKARSEVF